MNVLAILDFMELPLVTALVVGALAQELGVKVLSKADLPKEPHSLKKERPPILLLREVQQNFLIAKQQQNRKSK